MFFLLTILLLLTSVITSKDSTTKTPETTEKTQTKQNRINHMGLRIFNTLMNGNSMLKSGGFTGLALLGLTGVAALSLMVPFITTGFGLALKPDLLSFRRSLEDIPKKNDWFKKHGSIDTDKIHLAKMMMHLFDRLGRVKDTECRKLIVCEVQRHPVTRTGTIGQLMMTLFSNPNIEMDSTMYKELKEAWKRGINNEDCLQIYRDCKMVRKGDVKKFM